MEASVESRLRYLEDRMKLLESLVAAPPATPWPRTALHLASAKRGSLGAERPYPGYRAVDTRSFVSRHRSLVAAALALAAAAVIAAAALALRRSA
jgi:hypothetical protein